MTFMEVVQWRTDLASAPKQEVGQIRGEDAADGVIWRALE